MTEPRDIGEILLPDELADWMSTQRWYSSKGAAPQLQRLGGWITGDGDVRISTHYILDRQPRSTTLYQVPLVERRERFGALPPVGFVGGRYLYDAPHDPAYARALLDLIVREEVAGGARGHRQPGARAIDFLDSAVLRGEQSNTSIICQVNDGAPVIIKIFRALHHGDNPDVVLQSAIAAAGSSRVPLSIGSISGEWPDDTLPGGLARGHVAFAQEFLPGAEDAWRVALRSAESGDDFGSRARELGQATAEVHRILAAVLPTRAVEPKDVDQILTGMRRRLEDAIREVPSLADVRDAAIAVIEATRAAQWPPLQRIHGDYHLGQVLATNASGWVLVDFEGEPLRAMSERSELDSTLRDVAGMLRSFDYAAGSVTRTSGAEPPADWAAAARAGFLAGYTEGSGTDLSPVAALLAAFELDKALYESVYEARNRPDWLGIPVGAIRWIAGRVG